MRDDRILSSSSDEESSDDDDHELAVLVFTVNSLTSDPGEPKNYRKTVTGPEQHLWIPSIREELENFLRRDAWKMKRLSTLPKGRKPIRMKWVFKKSTNPTELFATRAVAWFWDTIKSLVWTTPELSPQLPRTPPLKWYLSLLSLWDETWKF